MSVSLYYSCAFSYYHVTSSPVSFTCIFLHQTVRSVCTWSNSAIPLFITHFLYIPTSVCLFYHFLSTSQPCISHLLPPATRFLLPVSSFDNSFALHLHKLSLINYSLAKSILRTSLFPSLQFLLCESPDLYANQS